MSSFWDDLGKGIRTYTSATGFIFKHGLWYYYFFPLALYLFIAYGGYELGKYLAELSQGYVVEWFGVAGNETDLGWWNSIKSFFRNVTESATAVIIRIFFWLLMFKFSKYIVLIFLSPALAFLSEKTEKILTGNDYAFDAGQFLKDIMRGVLIAFRNIVIETAITLGLSIIGFFLSFLSVIVILPLQFIIGSYYYGYSMMDYLSERQRFSVRESSRFIRKNKGIAIGNGAIFNLLFQIPLLGYIYAPITAVVAATIAIHQKIDLSNSEYAVKNIPETDENLPPVP